MKQPPSKDMVPSPEMIGREDLCARVDRELVRMVRQRSGRVILVEGDRGMGKSCFLRRCKEMAAGMSIPSLFVLGNPRPGAPIPLLDALSGLLAEISGKEAQLVGTAAYRDLVSVLLKREPALRWRPFAEGVEPAGELAPDGERLRLQHTVLRFLSLVGRPLGIVLLLDDLNAMDAESSGILLRLCRKTASEAILVIASISPSSRNGAHHSRDLRSLQPIRMRLPCLSASEIGSVVTRWKADASHRQVSAVVKASHGRPRLVRLLLGLLSSGGLSFAAGSAEQMRKKGTAESLPQGEQAIAEALLDTLPPRRFGLLQAMASFGAPCSENHLVEVSGILASEVAEELEQCEECGLIEETEIEGRPPLLQIASEGLAALLIEQMTTSQRRFMHRRIAAILAEMEGSSLELLAVHRLKAGDMIGSFDAALAAGVEAGRRHRNREAITLLEEAVRIAEGPSAVPEDMAARAHEAYADILALVGRRREALDSYRLATRHALKKDDLVMAARNHRKAGEIKEQVGEIDRARESYQRGLELLGTPGPDDTGELREAGELKASLGWLYGYVRGDHERGISLLQEAMDLAGSVGDKRLEARALNGIGVILDARGDWPVAVEAYERAIRLNEAAGNRTGAASNYNNLAVIFTKRDHPKVALRYYLKGLRLDKELGNVRGLCIDYNNLGELSFKMGRWRRARRYHEQSRLIAHQLGDTDLIALSCLNFGRLDLVSGDIKEAGVMFEEAVRLRLELGPSAELCEAFLGLGATYREQGRLADARRQFEKGLALAVDKGARREQVTAELRLAETYLAEGLVEEADLRCTRASRLAHQMGVESLMGDVYDVYGRVLAASVTPEGAGAFFVKALEVLRAMTRPYQFATVLEHYGSYLDQIRQDGFPFLRKAEGIYRTLGAVRELRRVRNLIAGRLERRTTAKSG